MKILILNWRDIKNPMSGGAEILTHEIAKRWVKKGHIVIQISSKFSNSKKQETIDGIRIIRLGSPDARYLFSSVHFKAFLYYMRNLRGKVDVVIDEIHGLPFFTPWYIKEKKIALICEVSGELWYKMFGRFFGFIGRLAEIFYMRFVYGNIHFITISKSTKKELTEEGVNVNKISVIPMGITLPKKIGKYEKEYHPTLIFVGRLSQSKGIEDAIFALKKISNYVSDVKLWIVGRGDEKYIKDLKRLITEQKMDNRITFFGFVADEKKFELLAKAHILIVPSIKEGWGLIVSEAGVVGTPSIVYDVSGLRDVVKNGINGIIVKNKPNLISEAVIKLFKNKSYYKAIKENAQKSSKNYNWDKSADFTLNILKKI